MKMIKRTSTNTENFIDIDNLEEYVVYELVSFHDKHSIGLIIIKIEDRFLILYNPLKGPSRLDEFHFTNFTRPAKFIEVPQGTRLEFEV